ncbi:hypothetical protein H3H37_13285 [Duganella sp. LX20W]|uniref:DUF5666 domain-containing protein n=1 Tax=Rugamonas brunnea TaxID=2758569 RepID=A0A7W2ESX0_9BURK|nr:DUF5666 domain-containing protein [Rugamonas brunnea]MBA5638028.1 hypothetical protein [Rugamonas brunnea]
MHRFSPLLTFVAATTITAVLVACGGGSSTSATPGTITADTSFSSMSGTVTGFGSLIVDGVRIDNHAVLADSMDADGTTQPTELKLGQHVEVQHDANLVATAVHVMAEAQGIVAKVDSTAGTIVVDGQTVMVNTDPTAGPVTVFGAPYTGLADIKPGDHVEVHGLIKAVAGGDSVIQATRIEPTTPGVHDRVAGVVAALSTSAKTFKLGGLLIDYSAASILPNGATLANGVEVHVAIPLGTVTSGVAVKATVVRISDHSKDSHTHPSEVGGAIASVDTAAKTFTVAGVTVDATAANYPQNGRGFADLKVGTYIVATGTYDAGGVLKATSIVVRGADDVQTNGNSELHGTILNYVSLANFTVRDVTVDASASKLGASCGGTLANGVQVGVVGTLSTTGVVKATSISCESEVDGQSIVGGSGVASAVDSTGKTFTLTAETKTYTVKWTSTTLFVHADPSTLAGKRVAVEGTVSGTTLTATKIVGTGH